MTHCLLNLFVFIYSPPPYAATCSRQQRGLAAIYRRASARPAAGSAKGCRELGGNHFLRSFGQGKEHREEFLAPKVCGTDF